MTKPLKLDWQDRLDEDEKPILTLEEAAEIMGVNKQRAHYLEQQAIYKLWSGVWSDDGLLAMFEELVS